MRELPEIKERQSRGAVKEDVHVNGGRNVADIYGQNVFSLKVMRNYLSEKAYNSLSATIRDGGKLDPAIADEVAEAMKNWAVSKGASHFTHWFQPLTGTTAEKHDSFLVPDGEGGIALQFSGKDLIQGEPDASSFPSGGLRATFEARGYTAWDPTSPAFIKKGPEGATLVIPTVFCGYHGEALDKKTPLLRSMNAINKQLNRAAKLFGIDPKGKRSYATLGGEQEYFLIDKKFYLKRLDLIQTGRTLFGRKPPKHQQMEDHYFGAIRSRILGFMEDLDRELWKLGVPDKTRHNEVSPAQFEVAPVFEELNIAVDHNMMTMEVMRQTAEKHGLVCLLHEKPFAGVNGSGKHNNWAIVGPDAKNWLSPGKNPHENAKFLFTLCAVIKAVDSYASLLRATVASPGNDHRLGANEAPPAIISIFLGEQLYDVIEQIEKGGAKSSKSGGTIEIGVDSLPILPRDATDRNRTSPFAFTGAKFEFRAVGSNMSLAGPNVVLNTIVAEAIDEMCAKLEEDARNKKDFNQSLQKLLQETIKKHKRVLFNGDNYTAEWHAEAKKRGLPNLKSTPEALEALKEDRTLKLFEKHGVLSNKELMSRYEIYKHNYHTVVTMEANCALLIAKTQIIPAVADFQNHLANTIKAVAAVGKANKTAAEKNLLKEICDLIEAALKAADELEGAINKHDPAKMLAAMSKLREAVDALEGITPKERWPLPSYAEMLFIY